MVRKLRSAQRAPLADPQYLGILSARIENVLEDSAFGSIRVFGHDESAVEERLKQLGDNIDKSIAIEAILKQWVHAMSPNGRYHDGLFLPDSIPKDPLVLLAPAVVLRKRTERSLLRLFDEIIERIQGGEDIPEGVEQLVQITEKAASRSSSDDDQSGEETDREIYFPLPANDEQLEIVKRLECSQGVLVQGPPGTGKSHTIANLVSHLMANGQRVLVTSHTARALKVLKQKIPKEVEALCVLLLGNDMDALESLEDSVRGITDRHHTWSSTTHGRHVQQLTEKLLQAKQEEARLIAEIRAMRESETYQHPPRFGSYAGTAQAIGARLREEEREFGWMKVEPEEGAEPPLTDDEARQLLGLLRLISPAIEDELGKRIPRTTALPGLNLFSDSKKREVEARRLLEEASKIVGGQDAGLSELPRPVLISLEKALLRLEQALGPIVSSSEPWIKIAADNCLEGRTASWKQLLSTTKDQLNSIAPKVNRASKTRISGLPERDRRQVKIEAEALRNHLRAGGSLGFWIFRPTAVKESIYLAQRVRVDGHLCKSVRPLEALINWIDVAEALHTLRRAWGARIKPPTGSFAEQAARYTDLGEQLGKAIGLAEKTQELNTLVETVPSLTRPPWHDPEAKKAFRGAVHLAQRRYDLEEAESFFESLARGLENESAQRGAHPITCQLLDVVRRRDESAYSECLHRLERYEELRQKLDTRDSLERRLANAAPELARVLRALADDEIWDGRLSNFTAAWNWARTDAWLKRLNDPNELQRVSSLVENRRKEKSRLTTELAAEKAWGHCFARMTEYERQHLAAWKKAMGRVGKGTGKYAPKHRRAAREHMDECRSAIPAWIMPIFRVAETIRPTKNLFDVVVVDEASQSGSEALFLQYLAKKIVVVGDDKQISPESIGIHREDVDVLRQKHLADIPHNDAYGVDNSFFDQAEIRYPGRIRLTEHFRCMPEIIQFSNNLCYSSEPLVPLRQYGAGRIEPVVVTRHIETGFQEGRSPRIVNPPEANALVQQILACCESSAYSGMTMGVVSLLGTDQARLIERELLDALGPEQMEKRQLVCGDAYAFQGDERDVMFLSLVSAPTEGYRIGPLATEKAKRRLNVAASRARDQMWLFHTATLNDLSAKDLRYDLLEYCLAPTVRPPARPDFDIEELRRSSIQRRVDDSPPAPFDSWFEVDVFLEIAKRNYRVIPQYELAGFRIDLLVEGMKGRMAVECDGDFWHGPDRYQDDMARQRMLERCGLSFWRVRGSSFYRNPDGALEGLWDSLEKLAIKPSS